MDEERVHVDLDHMIQSLGSGLLVERRGAVVQKLGELIPEKQFQAGCSGQIQRKINDRGLVGPALQIGGAFLLRASKAGKNRFLEKRWGDGTLPGRIV